jgi:hypothetical protein
MTACPFCQGPLAPAATYCPQCGASTAAPALPGWYPDPAAPGRLLWWDGARFSHTTVPPVPAPAAPVPLGGFGGGYGNPYATEYGSGYATTATTVRRLADYQRLSGIFWIVLGVLQVLLLVTALAGAWNIYAGTTRVRSAKRIRQGDPRVPGDFDGVTGLVIIAVVNVFVGGFIGLILIGFDLYVRDLVLKNRHVFTPAAAPPAVLPGTGPDAARPAPPTAPYPAPPAAPTWP